MAGVGRAPKPVEQRRNRVPPMRGEWVDLKPLEQPVLPAYDRRWRREDGAAPRWLWDAWRSDPVTSQYGPADIAAARVLGERFDRLQPAEQRQRMSELGLTPKGKRDLRWRTPAEVKTIAEQPPVQRLRVVAKEQAG